MVVEKVSGDNLVEEIPIKRREDNKRERPNPEERHQDNSQAAN